MWVYMSATHTFRSRGRESSNTRKYALDSTDWALIATHALIVWGRFMGHLAKPAVTFAFGENSAIDVKFNFYRLRCRRKSYSLRKPIVGQRTTTLPAKLYSNTNVPWNNHWAIHEELQELGVSPQQLNNYFSIFVFSFTEITFFWPSDRLTH